MIVATVAIFGWLALIGGCHGGYWSPEQSATTDFTGYLSFVLGAGVTAVVLWIGRWIEED